MMTVVVAPGRSRRRDDRPAAAGRNPVLGVVADVLLTGGVTPHVVRGTRNTWRPRRCPARPGRSVPAANVPGIRPPCAILLGPRPHQAGCDWVSPADRRRSDHGLAR